MESAHRKRRYSRYNSYRNNKKGEGSDHFFKKVANQVMVCGIIFLIVIGVKNINSPLTDRITNQIKNILGYTVDVNNAYDTVETFTENVGLLKPQNSEENNMSANDDLPSDKREIIQQNSQEVREDALEKSSNEGAEYIVTNRLDGGLSLEPMEKVPQKAEEQDVVIKQKIVAPLKGIVTSKFGWRKHPLYQKELFHDGIDIDGKKGEKIVSAMNGEVIEVGQEASYGKYIKIKHEDEIYTLYAHCDAIEVKEGQKVEAGEVIGKVGNSGAVLGVHLHFEIWKEDTVLDPLKYLDLPLDSSL